MTLSHHNVKVDLSDLLNSSIHNFLGEVIGANVTSDTQGFTTLCCDFSSHGLEAFSVNTEPELTKSKVV